MSKTWIGDMVGMSAKALGEFLNEPGQPTKAKDDTKQMWPIRVVSYNALTLMQKRQKKLQIKWVGK